ncbi:GNAT family N-acetyltransferase [Sphaerisporangium aureirubrum]|uniref:GNAT family N-acetyltransferase n=1 Tax=Sphaerisporangium aureirubrum TaxID=1544736 RepID=A0ABW1NM30_9ACTN
MFPQEVIPAGRVVLRPLTDADADAIARGCADPEIARFVPGMPVPYTGAEARAFLAGVPGQWERGGLCLAVAGKADGEWLGTVSLKPPGPRGAVEIGYLVAPWARGRGAAAAAVRALTEWAFERGVYRVELVTDLDNTGSQRVAMSAGFRREGVQRGAAPARDGRYDDLTAFARLASDSGERQESYLPGLPGGFLSDGVVRLAPLVLADVDDYQALACDPDVLKYSVPGEPPDREDSVRRCRYTPTWWLSGERAELSIRDEATGGFAGHVQLMNVNPALGQAMIGYSLVSAYRGRGIMTRAVDLLADWCFTATAIHRLIAGTAVDNLASQHVLTRAGFTREALLKSLLPAPDGTRHDDYQWVRLRPT